MLCSIIDAVSFHHHHMIHPRNTFRVITEVVSATPEREFIDSALLQLRSRY